MVFQDTEHWTTNNRDAWGTGSQGGKFVMVLEFCPERISSGYLFACLLIYLFMVLSSYLGVLNYSLYSYILNIISFYLYYYLYFIIPLSILSLNIFTYVTWKCLSFTREVMLDFSMCISQCWYLLLSIVKKKKQQSFGVISLEKDLHLIPTVLDYHVQSQFCNLAHDQTKSPTGGSVNESTCYLFCAINLWVTGGLCTLGFFSSHLCW